MIKLYTDTRYLTEAYRSQVFPVLYDLVFQKNKLVLEHYKLEEEILESDFVVMPIRYINFVKENSAFKTLLELARSHDKPLWIYTAGDYGFTSKIPNNFTFRLGGFNSKMPNTTFVTPSFINDPYKSFLSKGFGVLEKESKPSIGFVGHAKSGVTKYVKEYINHLKYRVKRIVKSQPIDKQSFYPSSTKRAKYLSLLAMSNDLDAQFILRNQYRAGSHSLEAQEKSSQEFYNNIYNTAYTFCIRGVGNFSVRFYETLAVGRIPILLNTDCRLPLDNVIDWSKHCLIIDETSGQPIVKQILNFHNNLSPDAFKLLQQSNRDLWLNKLRLDLYFIEVYKQFKTNSK